MDKRRKRNLAHVRVGAWWKAREIKTRAGKNVYTGPKQIGEIDRSDPLQPAIRWAADPTSDRRYRDGGRSISVDTLLKFYVPCDPPAAADLAPKTNGAHVSSKGAGDYLRDIVREEIALGLAAFFAELRPALRTEAEKAVRAAFGEATQ